MQVYFVPLGLLAISRLASIIIGSLTKHVLLSGFRGSLVNFPKFTVKCFSKS